METRDRMWQHIMIPGPSKSNRHHTKLIVTTHHHQLLVSDPIPSHILSSPAHTNKQVYPQTPPPPTRPEKTKIRQPIIPCSLHAQNEYLPIFAPSPTNRLGCRSPGSVCHIKLCATAGARIPSTSPPAIRVPSRSECSATSYCGRCSSAFFGSLPQRRRCC